MCSPSTRLEKLIGKPSGISVVFIHIDDYDEDEDDVVFKFIFLNSFLPDIHFSII